MLGKTHCVVAISLFLGMFSSISSSSDYGTTGLIDIPTARFERDGELVVVVSSDERHNQFAIVYQATPWLQGTFRYSGFKEFFYWDRNYELKARLVEEGHYRPQLAVGVRDIIGTGRFGSEYIVASKEFYGSDFTIGVGWGRLAGSGVISNPLTALHPSFETRPFEFQGAVVGDFAPQNLFSGQEVGFFGGWRRKLEHLPLTAMVEYNPDQYEWDVANGGLSPNSPWSAGIIWEAAENVELSFSLQHMQEIGVGFSASLNSASNLPRRADDTFTSSYFLHQSELPPQINKRSWYDRLLFDVERSNLFLLEGTLSHDGNSAQLVVGNNSYVLWLDAIERHIALADLHLPASVRTIQFIVEEAGHRTATIVVPRPSTSFMGSRRLKVLSGRTLDNPRHRTSFVTGKLNSTINLRSRFQLFDPDDPARYQVFAELASEYTLTNHWALRSSISINLYHNFDESNRLESDSKLPKVRSDIVKYLNEGDSGLEKLIIEGRDTIGESVHFRGFVGYLESMYAGVGGEVLYWPFRSRLAYGLSLAYVKQRDFDRGFDLGSYDVVSGHASAYWASPFYNYDFALHIGRYLAGDAGATFETRRTFSNGWQVGIWATITDVPFDDFGEGSFDKGLYFQIPLDGLFGSRTRATYATRMRPVQRDGGQRLEDFGGNIFWDLRSSRFDALTAREGMLP